MTSFMYNTETLLAVTGILRLPQFGTAGSIWHRLVYRSNPLWSVQLSRTKTDFMLFKLNI